MGHPRWRTLIQAPRIALLSHNPSAKFPIYHTRGEPPHSRWNAQKRSLALFWIMVSAMDFLRVNPIATRGRHALLPSLFTGTMNDISYRRINKATTRPDRNNANPSGSKSKLRTTSPIVHSWSRLDLSKGVFIKLMVYIGRMTTNHRP